MLGHMKLYLFGDQTFDLGPHLLDLLRAREDLTLHAFLPKAYNAIRSEIYSLPPAVRIGLPRFTCIEDLITWKRDGSEMRYIPLDMAMTTLWQLAAFMYQSEASWYDPGDTRVVGLCTGAFAAAAVSCSQSNKDLVSMAVDAIIVSFRTGVLVSDVAQRLGPTSDVDQNWSILVGGETSATSVQAFNDQSNLSPINKPYISAYAPHGITVSGPPASIAELKHSEAFKSIATRDVPIFGPYHAPHLYTHHDAAAITSDLSHSAHGAKQENIPHLLTRHASLDARDFSTLLKDAVEEVLLYPIQWNDILSSVQANLHYANGRDFSVVPFGSNAHHLIYDALKNTTLHSLVSPLKPINGICPPHGKDGTSNKPKLAIIGMSGRFPDAKDNDAFWEILYNGLDVHKPVPPLHWDLNTHVDTSKKPRKNTSRTPFGCWLENPEDFDARFFNISPKEASQVDPAQRMALMTAYEAIEQAGLVPDATPSTRPDRVGVFYGVTSNDWMETNSAQNIDTYMIPGGNRAFIPGRINYFFKFSGPSYSVDTACSSSLAAIHVACNSLWCGDIDTAIAGGTNVLTNPDFTAGLDRGHFLSRTGNCKTFDDDADGYCRGEGIATLIMKRLDDALADNDPILGVILGAYTNHSAESQSITRPHAGAQRAIFTKILNEAAVDPYSVSYIEMHGTGTQAGDAAEMSSVLDTFAPPPSSITQRRTNDEDLYLGSAKANIGHGEAASGACGLIKVLMMMERDLIVPHCGIKTVINHKFPTDLESRHVHIARKPTVWQKINDLTPRRAFINNFSAAGGNTAVLIEDAPWRPERLDASADSRRLYAVAASAKNGSSLQQNLGSLLKYLQENPNTNLGELSYTTTARRIHHQHRVLCVGTTAEELCEKFQNAVSDNIGVTRPIGSPSVVFCFTGQGAQYPGMGKQLFEESSIFRSELYRLDLIARSFHLPSILTVIESGERDIGVFQPSVVQLASVCIQIALVKLWASWNIHPTAVVGHSLGEYAALNAAGVLSEADTIFLVGERARLLELKCERGAHAMLVVDASVDKIAAALKEAEYETACINSPTETVLAAPTVEIPRLVEALATAGMKTTTLKVSYAFHSSQMDPILQDFERSAAGVAFSDPKIPIIRPLDGTVAETSAVFGPGYLARHCREPVNMLEALTVAEAKSCIGDRSTVLEIGPHPAISKMVRANLGSNITTIASMQRGTQPWDVLSRSLKPLYDAGAQVDWAAYQRDFKQSHTVLSLPAYAWDLKPYWIQYVNDWSLRKGDAAAEQKSDSPRIESTTIHSVVEESEDSNKTKIVIESNIAREDLSPLVQGHEVDGIPLCTPSVYADIALTLGTYLLQRHDPNLAETLVDVSDMTVSKALILSEQAQEQLIQVHAEADWASKSVAMRFLSFDGKGKTQEHSRCVVRFKDSSLQKTLQSRVAEIREKVQVLRNGIVSGETARFNRPMVYRAIRPLARFHNDYRAIDEVVLNSNTLEASSTLSFGTVKRNGNFHTHPAIIDSLTQACGFTMNCNDYTDLDKEVFMNHGWGSLQIFTPIDFEKVYTTYTRMEAGPDKLWRGDAIILDGDQVVAHFGQIAIQGVPRRLLKVILSLEQGKKSQPKPQAKPQPKAQPVAPVREDSSAPQTSSASSRSVSQQPVKRHKSSKLTTALKIISEESGVAVNSLTDTINFADIGVDSLLGLTISARFKEQLDIDLDFNDFFYEHPTVKDLAAFLGDSTPVTPELSSGSSAESSDDVPDPVKAEISKFQTREITKKGEESVGSAVDFQSALQIISEESGVATSALDDGTNLADCGVDSLMSLIIASRFRDELSIDVDNEALFLQYPTVGDVKQVLTGKSEQPPVALVEEPEATHVNGTDAQTIEITSTDEKVDIEYQAKLDSREQAVNELVERYTAKFSAPEAAATTDMPLKNQKVVLVTGASGSLGGHLTYHLAQLGDVKNIICLNREHRDDAGTRQQKAMRSKGIRFPDALKSKLLVLQTDSSKPKLGLDQSQYHELTTAVTHLVHQAWPMSAKRALPGFESQFQVMRNLLDFARDVASVRPEEFKFSFQMVSSIGVVGFYNLYKHETKTIVPEDRASIDSVLPNGYSEAKWGCERMLDKTLHQHPSRFRTMVVRLGQIAGSKTSGYWNPMEHFGFLVKSSQTLNALPDVDGLLYWTPVNDIGATLSDLLLANNTPHAIYHIDNPKGQPWKEMNKYLQDALKISNLIPFHDWLERVRQAPQKNNPAVSLLEFLHSNYLRMSCGGLVLDVSNTLEHSKTLQEVGPVSENTVRKYIHIWREIGYLQSNAEDKASFEKERKALWS